MSDRVLALGYKTVAKIKMRTGGSIGEFPRTTCSKLAEGDGVVWDLHHKDDKYETKLPVKYRYRSPVVFEMHNTGKRGAAAYAIIWLQHLVDNEPTEINVPIWQTKYGARLTQNYVTEENLRSGAVKGLEDIEEVGRLMFRCQFKAGTDESHEQFVTDSDSRETFETWEACLAEGVRERKVEKEMPDNIDELHQQSLTQSRDVLKQASPEEKRGWLAKDGTDWSGAFGHDPKAYMDTKGRKRAEPGVDGPIHDPHNPSDDEDNDPQGNYDDDDSDSEPDLGVSGAKTGDFSPGTKSTSGNSIRTSGTGWTSNTAGTSGTTNTMDSVDANKANKRTEHRKQRGLMEWKPVRNAAFAKDNAKFALRRVKNKFTGGLNGREPGVETEA